MRSTLKQRNRLALAASRPTPRQTSFSDRIAVIAELGAATLAAERCAIAFQSGAAAADEVAYAPREDSRWPEALNALLDALANRVSDAIAGGERKRRGVPAPIESIERIALSANEIDAIACAQKISDAHQLAAAAFTNDVSAVRIAIVARADRARANWTRHWSLWRAPFLAKSR